MGGPSNLHADIMSGRDCRIDVDDVFSGMCGVCVLVDVDYELANVPFHVELEKRLRI